MHESVSLRPASDNSTTISKTCTSWLHHEKTALLFYSIYRTCQLCQSGWNTFTSLRNQPRFVSTHGNSCISPLSWYLGGRFLSLDNYILLKHITAHSAYPLHRVTWLQAPSVPSTQCAVLQSFNFVDTESFYCTGCMGRTMPKKGFWVCSMYPYEGGPPYC